MKTDAMHFHLARHGVVLKVNFYRMNIDLIAQKWLQRTAPRCKECISE
jgi:hypothetical protein